MNTIARQPGAIADTRAGVERRPFGPLGRQNKWHFQPHEVAAMNGQSPSVFGPLYAGGIAFLLGLPSYATLAATISIDELLEGVPATVSWSTDIQVTSFTQWSVESFTLSGLLQIPSAAAAMAPGLHSFGLLESPGVLSDLLVLDAGGVGTDATGQRSQSFALSFYSDPDIPSGIRPGVSLAETGSWQSFSIFHDASGQGNSVFEVNVRSDSPSEVPLPAAAWVFGSALAGLGFVGKRRQPG